MMRRITWMLPAVCGLIATAQSAARDYVPGNRFMHLDEHEVYYPSQAFPKLTTPSWFGEPGVKAVVIFSIDDMRDPDKYEAYLGPIRDRLKQLEGGRSPLSIMSQGADPSHAMLRTWLAEGVSIDVHTTTHPCPLLHKQDLEKAANDVLSCIDALRRIPGNRPIAFRMPCCDSMNSVSPRFFWEIFGRISDSGAFMTMDSSVFVLMTGADQSLKREWVTDADGNDRFRKYVQFKNFVNYIEDYPYPYVIGNTVWEIPCTVPSDWEAQNRNGKNAPATVADLKRALAAVVAKEGVFTLVFHPHGWLEAEQVVELIDFAHTEYGRGVRFASFKDVQERIDKHLLGGWSLRSADGGDNGVRLLDLNADGHLDVVIGAPERRETRVWDGKQWQSTESELRIVDRRGRDRGVRFVEIRKNGFASALTRNRRTASLHHFDGKGWEPAKPLAESFAEGAAEYVPVRRGRDLGVRARDVDGDGFTDLIVNNESKNEALLWRPDRNRWAPAPFSLPRTKLIVDEQGHDRGLRFVDLNDDKKLDIVCSNEDGYFVRLFTDTEHGWSRATLEGKPDDKEALPLIVRSGTNNGVWFRDGALFVQNEWTGDTPDRSLRRELPTGN